ncbi:sensor histidine kinase [Actinomadura kijaniata]|uniref:Oxygen sensor histidine kinase NreB n=1 Tax=Actinomadura namibiensis TaxID=182080 RepID=A0A7W3LK33_ACTNM|nr:sensor histidine kinase [Actinomadura namibiensis]MBA8949530.1 signal transduction histidine kinase [Actinomadura namibiensis]
MTGVERRIQWAMHTGFFLLLAASASRFVVRHGLDGGTAVRLALAGALAVLYAAGMVWWDALGRRRPVWLAAVTACWLALALSAPSFGWCAIPLFFVALRLLPPRAALALVAVLTAAFVAGQVRLSDRFDPSLVLVPVAAAGTTATIFLALQRIVDDLVRTRDELAAAQRAAGVLAERQRLSREIHDTLAQGLTSMGMLLQAADREWDHDPGTARAHVRRAADTATANLAEARRFVRALAPPDLAAGSLPDALRALADRENAAFRVDGVEYPLAPAAQETLLRIAQSAVANAREHAAAPNVVITLSYLDDAVSLDVADDGVGFDPARADPRPGRGYGLRGMRERVAGAGGDLAVESAPGEGTVVAATIPRSLP